MPLQKCKLKTRFDKQLCNTCRDVITKNCPWDGAANERQQGASQKTNQQKKINHSCQEPAAEIDVQQSHLLTCVLGQRLDWQFGLMQGMAMDGAAMIREIFSGLPLQPR